MLSLCPRLQAIHGRAGGSQHHITQSSVAYTEGVHKRTEWSLDPEASREPSGLNATHCTGPYIEANVKLWVECCRGVALTVWPT